MSVTIYLTRRLSLCMLRQTPGQVLTICPDICPGVANLSRRKSRRLTALPNCPGVPAYFRQALEKGVRSLVGEYWRKQANFRGLPDSDNRISISVAHTGNSFFPKLEAHLIVASCINFPWFGYTHETMFTQTEHNGCCSWLHATDQLP